MNPLSNGNKSKSPVVGCFVVLLAMVFSFFALIGVFGGTLVVPRSSHDLSAGNDVVIEGIAARFGGVGILLAVVSLLFVVFSSPSNNRRTKVVNQVLVSMALICFAVCFFTARSSAIP